MESPVPDVFHIVRSIINHFGPSFSMQSFADAIAEHVRLPTAGEQVALALVGEPVPVLAGSSDAAVRLAAQAFEVELGRLPRPEYLALVRRAGFAAAESFPLLGHAGSFRGTLQSYRTEPADIASTQQWSSVAELVASHLDNQALYAEAVGRAGQLESALRSRVVIEQAKGMIAQASGASMTSSFGSLREYARHRGARLAAVAGEVVSGELGASSIPIAPYTMDAVRRGELRGEAVTRWSRTVAEAKELQQLAGAAVTKSAVIRAEVQAARGRRVEDAMDRAQDGLRRARELQKRPGHQPQVLVGDLRRSHAPNLAQVLGRSSKLRIVGDSTSTEETVGTGLVAQPDLVVLHFDDHTQQLAELISEVRLYCPETRVLIVIDALRSDSASSFGADAIASSADSAALLDRALSLCAAKVRATA